MANILFWMLLVSVVVNIVLFNVKQQWKEEYYACLRDALQKNAEANFSAFKRNIKHIKESNNETI